MANVPAVTYNKGARPNLGVMQHLRLQYGLAHVDGGWAQRASLAASVDLLVSYRAADKEFSLPRDMQAAMRGYIDDIVSMEAVVEDGAVLEQGPRYRVSVYADRRGTDLLSNPLLQTDFAKNAAAGKDLRENWSAVAAGGQAKVILVFNQGANPDNAYDTGLKPTLDIFFFADRNNMEPFGAMKTALQYSPAELEQIGDEAVVYVLPDDLQLVAAANDGQITHLSLLEQLQDVDLATRRSLRELGKVLAPEVGGSRVDIKDLDPLAMLDLLAKDSAKARELKKKFDGLKDGLDFRARRATPESVMDRLTGAISSREDVALYYLAIRMAIRGLRLQNIPLAFTDLQNIRERIRDIILAQIKEAKEGNGQVDSTLLNFIQRELDDPVSIDPQILTALEIAEAADVLAAVHGVDQLIEAASDQAILENTVTLGGRDVTAYADDGNKGPLIRDLLIFCTDHQTTITDLAAVVADNQGEEGVIVRLEELV
ncbi:MAG: hypothetical protein ABH823_01450 [bacterium]